MKKTFSHGLLIVVIVSGLALMGTAVFPVALAATNVSGILSSDTTWTKASSPYSLTGNLLVSNGVTLTVDAGVTVDLNGYYIMVNGTLRAQGSGADKVHFDSGEIIFTQYSNGWNEQTSSGCIFEHASLTSSVSSDVSLKLTNVYASAPISAASSSVISYSSLNGETTFGDSSVISHNVISAEISVGDSSTVTSNTIATALDTGNHATIANNDINGSITSGSSSIMNNTITGTVTIRNPTSSDVSEIRDNTLKGGGTVWEFVMFIPTLMPRSPRYPRSIIDAAGGSVEVTNNIIISQDISSQIYGISVSESEYDGGYGITTQANCIANIHGNVISGGFVRGIHVVGPATIYENVITNNSGGIAIGKNVYDYGMRVSEGDVTIRSNTLEASEVGISGAVINSYYGEVDYSATPKARTITIERNKIAGSQNGVNVDLQDTVLNIQNNTITNCSVAITLTSCPSATINFNNIQNYIQNSIKLVNTSININATYNWWGTTNDSTISQSIYDFKNDFYLGNVNFTPFLTQPNLEAQPIPEFPSWAILPLLLATILTLAVYKKKLTKKEE